VRRSSATSYIVTSRATTKGNRSLALPNVNLGELKTNGVDADINYKLSNTPVGSFKFD